MADSLATQLRDELARLLGPLAAADTTAGITSLLAEIGRLDNNDAIGTELQNLATLVSGIASLDDSTLESWDGLTKLLALSQQLLAALRGLEAVVSDPSLAAQLEGLGVELVDLLAGQYIRAEHPRLHRAAAVLTLLEPAELVPPQPIVVGADGSLIRLPWQPELLHLERLPILIDDPFGTLKAAYFPNDLSAAADAHESARLLFPLLRGLARTLGLDSSDGVFDPSAPPPQPLPPDCPVVPDPDPFPLPPPDEVPPPPAPVDLTAFQKTYFPRFLLTLPVVPSSDGTAPPSLGLAVLASSAEHPGGLRGLVLTPTGDLSWSETIGSWRLTMAADAQIPAFVVGPGGLSVAPISDPITNATATLTIALIGAPGAPAFLLGSATGTRLELGTLQVAVAADIGVDQQSVELTAQTTSAVFVFAAGDGDGFLSSVLPASDFRVNFDFGIVLSSATGLHLKGGAGMNTAFPTSISVGPAELRSITLAIDTSAGVALVAAAAVSVEIGPITAVVQGVGLRLAVSFPSNGGNVGPTNLDLGFAPPTGVGLSIDAGVVTGGGFLAHSGNEYGGALELAINDVLLKAYGLVQTQLPGGQPGYSLIVVISTQFSPPVELPFGFTLDGVGGLIGVNRTIDEDAIEAALWAHHLDGLLFPANPVAAAPQLLSALDSYFPGAHGRYVFGPLAKLGWGGVVEGEVALLFELPEPIKLLLIGDIQAVVPPVAPQLRLYISFDGGIDFGKKLAFFDASLHNSYITAYPISGDLAFRYGWGDDGSLALALGGFNPNYQPPPGFPALKRLAITIGSSVAQIQAQAYLALTSNTLQFGARVELTAGTGGFNVHGWLEFDALCERDPVSFEFDLSAGVDLRHGTDVLASVQLDGKLSGPSPWHISGDASISLLFFSLSVHFDKTWGDTAQQVTAPDPLPAVLAALCDPSGWSGALGVNARAVVTMLGSPPDAGDAVLLDPAGSVCLAQRAIPLGEPVTRFAGVPLGRTVQLTIDDLTVLGTAIDNPTPTTEEFAPGQFLDLSDADQLSLPSFSPMDAGVEVGAAAVDVGSGTRTRAVATPFTYDTTIIDTQAQRPGLGYGIAEAALLAFNASAQGARSGLARYAPPLGVAPLVALAPERWVVAGTADLALDATIATDGTKLATKLALDSYLAANPAAAGQFQVVLAGEAA